MKKTSKTTETSNAPAIVLYGLDESGRPRASWFVEADAVLAEKAAAVMNMKVLRVTTPEHRAVASELTAGRVFASGRAFAPFVVRSSFDRVAAIEGAYQPVAATPPTEPMPETTNVPASWSEIEVGGIVLAADGEVQGWYEAQVVEKRGDLFALRWLNWPQLPTIIRRSEHLSLISAAALEATREQAGAEP